MMEATDFRLEAYRQTDRDQFLGFVQDAHGPAAAERFDRQWDWKFERNPFNAGPEPYVLLLRDRDAVIGALCAIRQPLWASGTETWITTACDLLVRQEYRSHGLGRRLVERYARENPVSFSWLNDASYRAAAGLPKSTRDRLTSLARPVDLGLLVGHATRSGFLGRLAGVLPRGRGPSFGTDARSGDFTVSELDGFDERFDPLWFRARALFPVSIRRDHRYLSWRYDQRPDADYRLLVATRGTELLGYLVARVADRNGCPWGQIVDFLTSDASGRVFDRLLREAIALLRELGVAAISSHTGSTHRRDFYRRGFFPARWGPASYMMIRVESTDPTLQIIRDRKMWHTTPGDGDLETAR